MKQDVKQILTALSAPFADADIEWRAQASGEANGKAWVRAVPYITARAVTARLNDVCGLFGWRNTFRPWRKAVGDGEIYEAQICVLEIREPDTGEWVGKEDGADCSDIEPVKGGLSDAFKRAAVHWGIGSYLYAIEPILVSAQDSRPSQKGYVESYVKRLNKTLYWYPPTLSKKTESAIDTPPAKPAPPAKNTTSDTPAKDQPAQPLTLVQFQKRIIELCAADKDAAVDFLTKHGYKSAAAIPVNHYPALLKELEQRKGAA